MNQVYNCHITHIEIVGRLIKVWVQHNSKVAAEIEDAVSSLKDKLEFAEAPASVEQLSRNAVYFSKYSGDDLFRCSVIGRSTSSPSKISVAFIDFGNTQAVTLSDMRIISNDMKAQFPALAYPGQATFYYLSGIAVKPGSLSDRELDWLKHRTLNTEFPCCMFEGAYGIRMITILLEHNLELSNMLIQKNLGQMISRDELCTLANDLMHYSANLPFTNIMVSSSGQKYQSPVSPKIEVVSSQSSSIRKPSMPIYQPPPVYQQQMSSVQQQQRFIVPKDNKLANLVPFPTQSTVKKAYDNTITVGNAYQMYVSYVEDSTSLQFCLQLKQYADEVLPYLSVQMNKLSLQKFTSAVTVGMIVIGMHPPDKTLRRAMITNVGSNTCKVYYVDLGSSENLQHSNIYQLPTGLNITQIPAVAIPFTLKGMDPTQVTDSMKIGFRDLVISKVVLAKVITEGPVRTCDLFVDGRDIRTLLANFNQPLQYLRQFPPRDKDTTVVVSYVEGPQQIFVQYKSEAAVLATIESTLNSVWTQQKEITNVNGLTIGKPVLSVYSSDNQWYRAQVMEIGANQIITVLYVDYGNKEFVNSNTLREISSDLVSKWRCQAVECCLVGFDCVLPSDTLADKLEERILSSEVTLRVHSLLSADRLLVDLIDSSGNSVAAYLSEIHNNIIAEAQKIAALNEMASNPPREEPATSQSVVETKTAPKEYSYDEPKQPRVAKDEESKEKRRSRDSNEDLSTKWKSKEQDSSGKWKSSDSHDHDPPSSNKWKSKDSHDDRWKSKDSHDDRWRSKDSHDDRWKSKDSHDDRWKSKDSQDDRWKSKGSHDDRWKSKDSHDDRWKSKDSHDDRWKSKDSHDDRWKSKDSSYDDKWKSNKMRDGGTDFDSHKKSEKWSDNKFKGKDDKWNKDEGAKWKGGKNERDDNRGKWNKEERFHVGEKKSDWKSKDSGSRKYEDDGRKGRGEFKWKDSTFSEDYDSKKTARTLYSDTPDKDKSFTKDDSASTSDIKFNPKVKEYVGWNLDGQTSVTVTLAHIDSPERFFVRPLDAEQELEKLRDIIDSDSNAMSRVLPSRAVIVGTPVLAVYSEDNNLYRAVIEKVNSKTVDVLFVDYGNSAEIPCSELYYPCDNLARLPMTVIRCSLTNVKPPGSSWTTDTDALINCFGKESQLNMTIETVKLVDGLPVHNVSLTVVDDGKSVALNLVDAGFAKSSVSGKGSVPALHTQESVEPLSALPLPLAEESSEEEVWVERLELLVGQFLLSKVLSIVSMETVIVKLDATNLIVICTSPDIDTSSVQIGDKVIIHVNCVLEDRLRVTVYDKGGYVAGDSKHELPQVSPVCPMPVTRSRFRISVPHCEQSFLYVQKTSDSDRIAEMLDSLFAFYEGTKSSGKEFAVNSLCTVKSADENWYRARIIKKDNEMYTIRFIDYGNTEEVDSSQIRKLDNQFFYPELAFKAEVHLKWRIPTEDIDLMKYVADKEFNANFVKINTQDWNISLEDDDKRDVSKILIDEGLAENYKENPFFEANSVIGDDILTGDKIPVTVTHVESPELFWVQMVKHIQTVETIQEKLQTVESRKDNNCAIFAAKYSADQVWYRALNIDPDNPDLVRFVDYGNTDIVTERKELYHSLTKPRSGYAVKMCLCATPKNGSDWSEEALRLFEEFIDADQVIAEVVCVSYKIVSDLTVNGNSISNLLIEKGHAVYEDFTPALIKDYLSIKDNQVIQVFVCHTLSVNDFYALDKNREPELEELSMKLADCESYPAVKNPKVGDLVMAKFPEDEAWYRATITELKPLNVLFIDFGNCSIVEEIGQVPSDVKCIPPFGIHCSLGFAFESDLALDKFIELGEEGKSVFSLSIVKKGDPNIVKMTLNEGDVVDLLPKVQNNSVNIDGQIGYISHLNSCDDFYIQLKDDLKLDNVIDELSAAENFGDVDKSLSSGSLVAAQFPEDNEWYRAKVLSLDPLTVIFYDYGNTSEVINVKELPPDLKLIPAIAYRCSLEKPKSTKSWTDAMLDSFLELSQDGSASFSISVVKEGSPNIVSLNTEDKRSVTDIICEADKPINTDVSSLSSNIASMNLRDGTLKTSIDNKLVTISHFVSVTDFYVILDNNLDSNKVENLMAKVESFEENIDPSVGDIVAAQYPEVEEWKRAKIISAKPLKVFFIDDGMTSVVYKTRKLPKELHVDTIKPLAYHCSLKKPNNCDNWPSKMLEDYMTLSTDKLKVVVHSQGNPIIGVSLFLDDKNINDLPGNSFDSPSEFRVDSSDYNDKTVYIAFGESVSSFFVQREEDSVQLDKVQNELSLLSDKFNAVENPTVGSLVAAVCPDDDVIYRARVISITPEILVTFIDYGNSSTVPSVCLLPDNLKNIRPFVLHCCLKLPQGLSVWPTETKEKFSDILCNSDVPYTLKVENHGDPAVVSLMKEDQNIINSILTLEDKKNPDNPSPSTNPSVDMNNKLAILSHVNSLDEFYVQLLDDAEKIGELFSKLAEGDDFAEIKECKEGLKVAAQYVDMQWHRAIILKILDDEFEVVFTDYGNTSTVKSIRELPKELLDLPPMIYKLKLKKPEGIPEWTEQMEKQFALFKDLNSQPLVILTHPALGCVSLMLNDVNIYNKFTSLSLDKTNSSLVFVTYCESPSDFYVQYNGTLEIQEKIFDTLKDADDFAPVEDLKEGDLVCAQYPDDGMWYRSKILKLSPEISAMFIDFGNNAVITETKVLPDELKEIEPLAKHCRLVPPQCGSGWSPESSSYFLAMGSSPFTISVIEEGEPTTVDLFIDGNSVTSDLLELCPMIERLPESSQNDDLDIDEEDVMREEAIFNAEQPSNNSENNGNHNNSCEIICNGISELKVIDEESEVDLKGDKPSELTRQTANTSEEVNVVSEDSPAHDENVKVVEENHEELELDDESSESQDDKEMEANIVEEKVKDDVKLDAGEQGTDNIRVKIEIDDVKPELDAELVKEVVEEKVESVDAKLDEAEQIKETVDEKIVSDEVKLDGDEQVPSTTKETSEEKITDDDAKLDSLEQAAESTKETVEEKMEGDDAIIDTVQQTVESNKQTDDDDDDGAKPDTVDEAVANVSIASKDDSECEDVDMCVSDKQVDTHTSSDQNTESNIVKSENDDVISSSTISSEKTKESDEASCSVLKTGCDETISKSDVETAKQVESKVPFDEKLVPGVVSRGEIEPEPVPPKTPTEDKILPGCVQGVLRSEES